MFTFKKIFLCNMHLTVLVIWAIFSVMLSAGMIIWKCRNLNRKAWYDFLAPIILIILGFNYTFYGFLTGCLDLGFLMLIIYLNWMSLYICRTINNVNYGSYLCRSYILKLKPLFASLVGVSFN